MAQLIISFNNNCSDATHHTIKYRKIGTTAYSTITTTAIPATINNLEEGAGWEGTVMSHSLSTNTPEV